MICFIIVVGLLSITFGLNVCDNTANQRTDTSEAAADEFAGSTLFKGNIWGPIASSMDDSMFQLVISKWRYAFDGLKETKEYNFLSAAGSLMKNMVIIPCLLYAFICMRC